MSSQKELRVRDLRFRYGSSGASLGPLSFEAGIGEIWAVLGSNGAGKSTLFKLIDGELKPKSGSVSYQGTSDLIPQGASIPGRLSVRQTFEYLAQLRGVPRQDRAERIEEALRLVSLKEQENARVGSLSGGQYRRVVVGQALIAKPEILLMDEPSTGLDLEQRATLKDTVRAIGKSCVLMVSSHVVEDLVEVADHVLHLVDGAVVYAGTISGYIGDGDAPNVEQWTRAYHLWNTPKD